MISDPIVLRVLLAGPADLDGVKTLSTRDLSLGKTVRSAVVDAVVSGSTLGGIMTMTISHSESRENKGQTTDRTSVRLECLKTLETGESSVAQATLTVSSPRLGFVARDIEDLVATLLGTLVGEQAANTISFSILGRVLDGEP